MNNELFQCSMKYDKVMDNGLLKKTTETYLVEACSYTDAEARFIKETAAYISGEFEVSDIKRARIAEVFRSDDLDDDSFYKAKIAFITIDERTGEEKLHPTNILIQASDFRKAVQALENNLKGSLADYVIVSVAETKILDIFNA